MAFQPSKLGWLVFGGGVRLNDGVVMALGVCKIERSRSWIFFCGVFGKKRK